MIVRFYKNEWVVRGRRGVVSDRFEVIYQHFLPQRATVPDELLVQRMALVGLLRLEAVEVHQFAYVVAGIYDGPGLGGGGNPHYQMVYAFNLAEAFYPFDQRCAVGGGGRVFQPKEHLMDDHLPFFADVMKRLDLRRRVGFFAR